MNSFTPMPGRARLSAAGAALVAPLLAFAAFLTPRASACDDVTLRDAAFKEPRDVHRLCVIGRPDDVTARRMHERLENWLASSATHLNVELASAAPDEPGVRWAEYGLPSAPPSSPVIVLAGRRTFERKSFFIDHWESAPSAEDLEQLKTSPVREAIRREVVRRLAVLLYIPGTGGAAGPTEKVLDSVVKTWGEKEPLGLAVIRASRSDERERLLLSFVGAGKSGPDWVAVVFGRGKFTPPLQGKDVTEARLDELIEPLVGECTCLRSPASLGVDIPMVWDKALDAAVVPLRTADIGPPLRHRAVLIVEGNGSTTHRRVLARTIGTLGLLVVVVTFAAAVILWRRRHAG
jgi:hypothetical protein